MNIYDVYDVNHYFTPSDVKGIVDRYDSRDDTANQIMRYVVSIHPVIGLMSLAESISTASMIKTFQKAEAQGKGVRTKYEYWDGKSPSVHNTKNKSVTIE